MGYGANHLCKPAILESLYIDMLGIIIPTYDNLEMLKTLVGQIYSLTDNFRLYIIEDGGKEDTISYLKSIKEDNFTPIFHSKNEGVAKSWNDGLKSALNDGCDHLAVINDDIELCPGWWEECKKLFYSNVHLVCLPGGENKSPFRQSVPLTGWFFIIDRPAINRIGLFDENMAGFTSEDTDYAVRYALSGFRLAVADIPIKHYGSATINKIRKDNPTFYRETRQSNLYKLKEKHKNLKFYDHN